MEITIVGNTDELFNQCKERDVYIYGAKTIAQRADYFLASKQIKVKAFICSNKYKNPDLLGGKNVIRIEEHANKTYDCVIVAVSAAFIWDVEETLKQYQIERLVVISPNMDDEFPASFILSDECHISQKACISDKVQIVADETSSVLIDDNVTIKNGAIILAVNHSHIHFKSCSYVGRKALISADDNSMIEFKETSSLSDNCHCIVTSDSCITVGDKVKFNEYSNISVRRESKISIGTKTHFGSKSSLSAANCSKISLVGKNEFDVSAIIEADQKGTVEIGKESTFNKYLFIGCAKSSITIGDDNMFSILIKMYTGNHKIIDKKTNNEITNYKPIRTGNHVWVGMGATLLPGCDVQDGSIVGAASLLNKFVPANSICAGNPAKVIRNDVEWDRDYPPEQ